jgi:hypothetical protein
MISKKKKKMKRNCDELLKTAFVGALNDEKKHRRAVLESEDVRSVCSFHVGWWIRKVLL